MAVETMLDNSGPHAHPASFVVGVLLHIFIFRIGEWDLTTLQLITVCSLSFAAAVAALNSHILPFPTNVEGIGAAFGMTTMLFGWLILGIFSSMLLYRGFFHRLSRFPGPFFARFSGLYMTVCGVRKMRTFTNIQQLHNKFGDVVRVGPQELSIIRPSAVHALHSSSSPCNKGPFYDMTHPFLSLQTIRSKAEHAPIRKVWDRAFSAKSLRDYESRVAKYADQLLAQLEAHVGTQVNMANWMSFYGFDVMGDLAFGKSFDMLKKGVVDYYIGLMQDFLRVRAIFTRVPWMFRILQVTMMLNASFNNFRKWMEQQVKTRMTNEPDVPDVFSWILANYNDQPSHTQQDFFNLMGECTLITIAGSDTTSSTLTCLLFELGRRPEVYKKLQAEIDACFQEQGNNLPGHYVLSKLEYLQACIDEALRLYPPLPSGVQRITPPEGLEIDKDLFIPGDTIVQIPMYTMYRDERLFPNAMEFIPERWTSKQELVKDASCFTPFLTGAFSCVGRQLALMEIRYVISRIAHRYDLSLAKGQTPQAFIEGNIDTFTIRLAPLHMVLQRRAGTEVS